MEKTFAVPRKVSHDSYMDGFDWFCYFPSRNFLGTDNPPFKYPYIGKSEFEAQPYALPTKESTIIY